MKIRMEPGTLGIGLSIDGHDDKKLVPSRNANQTSPNRSYVYGHFDKNGVPFYIGKGTGRRAWDTVRHPLWHRYVMKHLDGRYNVVILEDDLSSDDAEYVESQWVSQEGKTLVNWVNYSRDLDYEALDKYHQLRNSNQQLIKETKSIEKTDPETAIANYYKVIDSISEYANIQYETGLVASLLAEERKETGRFGELEAINRLTLCLCRASRKLEALEAAEKYFEMYRGDAGLKGAAKVFKRVDLEK